jgi:hypothetical protein
VTTARWCCVCWRDVLSFASRLLLLSCVAQDGAPLPVDDVRNRTVAEPPMSSSCTATCFESCAAGDALTPLPLPCCLCVLQVKAQALGGLHRYAAAPCSLPVVPLAGTSHLTIRVYASVALDALFAVTLCVSRLAAGTLGAFA